MNERYIGVMSGTSLDGIDITLCEIDASQCKLIYAKEYGFDAALKEEILTVISGTTTLEQIGTLNAKLGSLFANSLKKFLKEFSIDAQSVKAIGLHGQTLWHEPDAQHPFSMQLGDPNIVSSQTGITTVSDFRNRDIANGGQGAPFAPAFHQFVFSHLDAKSAVLNIGGMANITILDARLKGWDIGAGNVLLDTWIQRCKNVAYDKEGDFAKSGEINDALLESFLSDAYFAKKPPKSTGREYFNENWIANHLPLFQTIKNEDIQRTLLELTAISISNSLKNTDITLLIVCGGGAKNKFLMQRLAILCPIDVTISDSLGVSSDFMESMAFAWLAFMRVKRKEVNLRFVTGAKKNSILGGIYG